MKARILSAVAGGATLLAWLHTTPALSSACSIDEFLHNGSVMEVQVCDGGSLTISYSKPRPGIAKHGAHPGVLFFNGVEGHDGTITGQARIFSARCGVATYPVTGKRINDTITMSGTAPIRGKGCKIARYQNDYLLFTPTVASHNPGPSTVAPQCPHGFVLSGGQCIRSGGGGGTPQYGTGGGDWYAIAGSFRSKGQAQARVNQLGGGWHVLHTANCPNMTPGYWIATAGGFNKAQAQHYAHTASRFGAYAKTCH